jgi:hypothetical protein
MLPCVRKQGRKREGETYGVGDVDGLTVVRRLESGELVPVQLDQVGQTVEQVGTIVAGGLRPRTLVERMAG